MPFVTEVTVEHDNMLLFIITKDLFGFNKDVALVCAYLPPEHSPYYKHSKTDSRVCILEQCLADLNVRLDFDFLVCGDMNDRTKIYVPDLNDPESQIFNHDNMYAPLRVTEDGETNSYGKMLLELCTTFSLQIQNGVCKADSKGLFTFVSEAGCIVADYLLVSSCLFNNFIK